MCRSTSVRNTSAVVEVNGGITNPVDGQLGDGPTQR